MKIVKTTLAAGWVGWFLLALSDCGNANGSNPSNDKDSTAAIPVEVEPVIRGDVSTFFNGTTTLEAEGDAQVVAKVSGIVSKIYVEEGDYVNQGQVLAQLDDEVYRIQLAQSEATMHRTEAEFKRTEALLENNAVSRQEFQRAKFEHQSWKAAHDLDQLNLDYTTLRAPLAGIVTERMIRVGNMVLANAELFRITNFDPLIAVLHIPERELDKLKAKQPALISVDAIEGQEFTGYVDRISPVVNPATGTVKVTVEVHDPSGQLKAGMFTRVKIIYDVHTNTLLVSKNALLKEDTETALFVVQDSLALRRVVETGYSNSTHVEVQEGISENDLVVTAGQGSLKDSALVEPITP